MNQMENIHIVHSDIPVRKYSQRGSTAVKDIMTVHEVVIQAMRHHPIYMADYVEHLDNVLKTTGKKVLQGAGTISPTQAIEKATEEYRKYQAQNLSSVEEEYLENIKNIHSTVKKNGKN